MTQITQIAEPARRAVLILGANGRFGRAALQAFAASGWQVIAALRREPVAALPPGVRVLHTAVEQTDQLAREARGASVVVHALNPPYTDWASRLLPLAHAGMDLAERLGARLMLPGNVYNFGAAMPECLVEDTPQRATSRKGALRARLESELERRCSEGRLAATVIRAGDFYGGAGVGTWFDRAIVKSIRAGKLVYPGPTDVPHAWAYLPDLAGAFVAVAGRSAADCERFERFHFAGHTLTGAQLLDGIERAAADLGLRPASAWSHGTLPWAAIRLGGLLIPAWRELAEMAYLWRVPHALDGAAFDRAVGPLPVTPAAEALRQALIDLGVDTPRPARFRHPQPRSTA